MPSPLAHIKNIFHKKRSELPFFIGGIIALIIVLYVFMNAISFLVSTLNVALGIAKPEVQPVLFNIQGLTQLGIMATTSVPIPQDNALLDATNTSSSPTDTTPLSTPVASAPSQSVTPQPTP